MVEFVSPVNNSVVARDSLDDIGKLIGTAEIAAKSTDERVAKVVVRIAEGEELAESGSGPDHNFTLTFDRDGVRLLEAVAYDAGGTVLGTANLRVTVATVEKQCSAWLDFLGVQYTLGPDVEGVIDPVTVQMPVRGIEYRYYYDDTFRTSLVADCQAVRAMALMAPYLKERNIASVVDIGVYDYRCIGGGTPPGCPQGISQHARARAIDLHAFVAEDGTEYNVEFDWVIDGEQEQTCGAATEGGKDEWLHDLVCEMFDVGLWTVALTPNWNAAHRNHFHVDVTPGADLMRSLPSVDRAPGHDHGH